MRKPGGSNKKTPHFLKKILKKQCKYFKIEIKKKNYSNSIYQHTKTTQPFKMNTSKMNSKITEQLLTIVNQYRQELVDQLAIKYGFDAKEAFMYLNNANEPQASSGLSEESDKDEKEPIEKQPIEKEPKAKKPRVKKVADVTETETVVDAEDKKAKKLAEKEAEKQAKLAEKEAEKKAKLAEKEAEKQAKLAEKKSAVTKKDKKAAVEDVDAPATKKKAEKKTPAKKKAVVEEVVQVVPEPDTEELEEEVAEEEAEEEVAEEEAEEEVAEEEEEEVDEIPAKTFTENGKKYARSGDGTVYDLSTEDQDEVGTWDEIEQKIVFK